jgi:hypothetical protein
VHDPGRPTGTQAEPAFLKHLQHRSVFRQNLRNQFLETGLAGNRGEMVHQCRANTLSLVLIDHGESNLGRPWPHDNVTRAADDYWSPTFLNHCDQGDVIDEVDVQEECDFPLAKRRFTVKKRR